MGPEKKRSRPKRVSRVLCAADPRASWSVAFRPPRTSMNLTSGKPSSDIVSCGWIVVITDAPRSFEISLPQARGGEPMRSRT